MSKKTSCGPVGSTTYSNVFFWLKRTISLVIETCGIVLNIYFIKYHSCSASAFAIPLCEQFYHVTYCQGCIILCVSMPPLPAQFQQRFRKDFWVGKSKLGHKFCHSVWIPLLVLLAGGIFSIPSLRSCWTWVISATVFGEKNVVWHLKSFQKMGKPESDCWSDVEIVGGLS